MHRFSSWRYSREDTSGTFRKACAARLITGMRRSVALHLEILFEELGDGGVAGDAVGVLEDIVAFILEDQIVGLLSGCPELLNDIPRLTLDDARVVPALNHQQRAAGKQADYLVFEDEGHDVL